MKKEMLDNRCGFKCDYSRLNQILCFQAVIIHVITTVSVKYSSRAPLNVFSPATLSRFTSALKLVVNFNLVALAVR